LRSSLIVRRLHCFPSARLEAGVIEADIHVASDSHIYDGLLKCSVALDVQFWAVAVGSHAQRFREHCMRNTSIDSQLLTIIANTCERPAIDHDTSLRDGVDRALRYALQAWRRLSSDRSLRLVTVVARWGEFSTSQYTKGCGIPRAGALLKPIRPHKPPRRMRELSALLCRAPSDSLELLVHGDTRGRVHEAFLGASSSHKSEGGAVQAPTAHHTLDVRPLAAPQLNATRAP
jgi:hypothetical protein